MFSEEVQANPKNAPPPITPLQIVLNSEDNMYSKLRDQNFGAVGTSLSKFAKEISAAFQVCESNEYTLIMYFVIHVPENGL